LQRGYNHLYVLTRLFYDKQILAILRRVVEQHEYKNILNYFNCMADLRREETTLRDYLIEQLQMSRVILLHCDIDL